MPYRQDLLRFLGQQSPDLNPAAPTVTGQEPDPAALPADGGVSPSGGLGSSNGIPQPNDLATTLQIAGAQMGLYPPRRPRSRRPFPSGLSAALRGY